MTHTRREVFERRGRPVLSGEGEKIGDLEEIYVDIRTKEPEWIGVTTGLLGTKRTLIPLENADIGDDSIQVPYSKDMIKNTPEVGDDREVSEETEAELYRHYGIQVPERQPVSDIERPATMTEEGEDTTRLTEEERRTGRREMPATRIRLRRFVETEPLGDDVELQRETLYVERETIDEEERRRER